MLFSLLLIFSVSVPSIASAALTEKEQRDVVSAIKETSNPSVTSGPTSTHTTESLEGEMQDMFARLLVLEGETYVNCISHSSLQYVWVEDQYQKIVFFNNGDGNQKFNGEFVQKKGSVLTPFAYYKDYGLFQGGKYNTKLEELVNAYVLEDESGTKMDIYREAEAHDPVVNFDGDTIFRIHPRGNEDDSSDAEDFVMEAAWLVDEFGRVEFFSTEIKITIEKDGDDLPAVEAKRKSFPRIIIPNIKYRDHGVWTGSPVNFKLENRFLDDLSNLDIDVTTGPDSLHLRETDEIMTFNKHVPWIISYQEGDKPSILVGVSGANDMNPENPVFHEQTPEHFIERLYVINNFGSVVTVVDLSPTTKFPVSVSIHGPMSFYSVMVYEKCNKHGLWDGPSFQLPEVKLDDTEIENLMKDHENLMRDRGEF